MTLPWPGSHRQFRNSRLQLRRWFSKLVVVDSNLWVIDGLDVTSGIRQGILNLTPNPDFVEEASNEVNIY
ncbi:MAG: hypothetical protein WBF35_14465, partial [Candidatus Acidiferrales bacterium]